MPAFNNGPYYLEYDASHMKALIARVGLEGPARQYLGQVVKKVGMIVQTRAIYNVTGHPFTSVFGETSIVRVRTGALRGSIELQYPYQNDLTFRVYCNGAVTSNGEKFGGFSSKPRPVRDYAWAIEMGHPKIDLKKTKLAGKTVPFFAARSASARGPYTATGLTPVIPGQQSYGAKFQSNQFNAKLAAKGKQPMWFTKKGGKSTHYGGSSSYFIAFRKVGKTGWIVPLARPRPFMRTAGENTKDRARLAFRAGIIAIMKGNYPGAPGLGP